MVSIFIENILYKHKTSKSKESYLTGIEKYRNNEKQRNTERLNALFDGLFIFTPMKGIYMHISGCKYVCGSIVCFIIQKL